MRRARSRTPPGSLPAMWPGGVSGIAGGRSARPAPGWAGGVLGNAGRPHRRAVLGFADGLAWVAQIGLFVLLGLLAAPGRLGGALVPAMVAGLALVLLARPLSVVIAAVAARPVRGLRRRPAGPRDG